MTDLSEESLEQMLLAIQRDKAPQLSFRPTKVIWPANIPEDVRQRGMEIIRKSLI